MKKMTMLLIGLMSLSSTGSLLIAQSKPVDKLDAAIWEVSDYLTKQLAAGNTLDIRNASGKRVGYIDGNVVRDVSGSRVGYIDGSTIRNASGTRVGYVDSSTIRNASGTRVGYMDGSTIRNASGTRVGYVDGAARVHAGAAGLLLLL